MIVLNLNLSRAIKDRIFLDEYFIIAMRNATEYLCDMMNIPDIEAIYHIDNALVDGKQTLDGVCISEMKSRGHYTYILICFNEEQFGCGEETFKGAAFCTCDTGTYYNEDAFDVLLH